MDTTIGLIAAFAQIIIGTGVRAEIDNISKLLNYQDRGLWISRLTGVFTMHKLSAVILSLICILIFWYSIAYTAIQKLAVQLLVAILLSVATGLVMASFHIPAFVQPLHLLLSAILFISLFALRLRIV